MVKSMIEKLRKILVIALITIIPVSTAYAAVNWLSLFAKVTWKVAQAASNQFYTVNPNIEEQCGWVRSSTGTIDFNSATYGASTYLNANLGKSNLNLDVFATIDPLNWSQTISVIVANPNGTDVINRSVTQNQHSFFDSTAPYGTYKIRYVENENKKWNCYAALTDWDVSCALDYASDSTGNIKEYVTDSDTGKIFFIPSIGHKTLTQTGRIQEVSLHQLKNQFFDSDIQEYVNSTKDFDIGDVVYVTAPVEKAVYNSETNSTDLIFKCDEDMIDWPFAGDLTKSYQTGDSINFEFRIVKEYEDGTHIFENVDYFINGASALREGRYVDIADYLK